MRERGVCAGNVMMCIPLITSFRSAVLSHLICVDILMISPLLCVFVGCPQYFCCGVCSATLSVKYSFRDLSSMVTLTGSERRD